MHVELRDTDSISVPVVVDVSNDTMNVVIGITRIQRVTCFPSNSHFDRYIIDNRQTISKQEIIIDFLEVFVSGRSKINIHF